MIANPKQHFITDRFIASLCARLSEDKRVRRKLPIWGRVHIDRQLPFLCVYRKPEGRLDEGTDRLLYGEASYLLASGAARFHESLNSLVKKIAETQAGVFGSFLIIEIWSGHGIEGGQLCANLPQGLHFRVHSSRGEKRKLCFHLGFTVKDVEALGLSLE